MTGRRVLEELPPEWPGGRIPPVYHEPPQRAVPTRWKRFTVWYGWGQPGFAGGTLTGLVLAAIMQGLILLAAWWYGR